MGINQMGICMGYQSSGARAINCTHINRDDVLLYFKKQSGQPVHLNLEHRLMDGQARSESK